MITLQVHKCFERGEKEWYDVLLRSGSTTRWAGLTLTEHGAQDWADMMSIAFPDCLVRIKDADLPEEF